MLAGWSLSLMDASASQLDSRWRSALDDDQQLLLLCLLLVGFELDWVDGGYWLGDRRATDCTPSLNASY